MKNIFVVMLIMVVFIQNSDEKRIVQWTDYLQFCGHFLPKVMKTICSTKYHDLSLKQKRGIVEECCKNPCQAESLKDYCMDPDRIYWPKYIVLGDENHGVRVITNQVSTTIKPTTTMSTTTKSATPMSTSTMSTTTEYEKIMPWYIQGLMIPYLPL